MNLQDIAAALLAHLKRIEADPVLNPRAGGHPLGDRDIVCPSVERTGSRISVQYRAVAHTLSKAEAAAYLAWLDVGNNGTHLDMIRRADG